jgi:maltose/moltooligosaccharide transporter
MRQLAWVQCFTWFGLYCFFLYFPPIVARNVFGATHEASSLYSSGIEWAGICIAAYNAVGMVFSVVLPRIAQSISPQRTHSFCLLCGATGLMSLGAINNKYFLLLSMVGVGIVWASVLAMPYAILADSLPPERSGIYMGIFNVFIVIPEIAVSLGFGWVMNNILDHDRLLAVVIGGSFLIVAAFLMQRVQVMPVEDSDREIKEAELLEEMSLTKPTW